MVTILVEQDLEMRLVAEEYAEEVCEAVLRNFDHLHKWMQWAVEGYGIGHTRSFFSLSLRQFGRKESMNLLIFHKGSVIGGSGLNFIDTVNRGTEIGYWLDKEHTGKGVVTKCCRALIEHSFRELAMHRINIRVASENAPSRAIPERLGFTEEGTLRQAELLHGKFVDLVVYGLLRSDWEPGALSSER